MAPPRDHHLLGIVSVGAHGVEDETRAEGDAFEDGAVHVRATVPEGETGDDPATQRIDVRGAIPLQVFLHHQTLAPGRNLRRRGVHLVVELVPSPAQRLVPVHHRSRGGLSALDHSDAVDQRAAVRAPHPRAVKLRRHHAEVEVRGPGDERELARSDGTEAHHGDESVRAALRDGETRGKAEVRRGVRGERTDDVAEPDDVARPFVGELGHVELGEEGEGRGALDEVPTHGDVVRGGAVAAGELEVDVILVLAYLRGGGEDFRAVLLEPQRLGHHPLGAHGAGAVAVDAERIVFRGQHLWVARGRGGEG